MGNKTFTNSALIEQSLKKEVELTRKAQDTK